MLTTIVPKAIQAGQVGGHEGVGIIHKLGPGSETSRVKVGDRVGIKVSGRKSDLELRTELKFDSGLPLFAGNAISVTEKMMVIAL
jgi:NADPH:quinone reductase-like Zn-dependent oxidoreductase